MSDSLAIVIPTHNRHNTVKEVVRKLISYYSGKCTFVIFVLDSSATPLKDLQDDCVKYIHCPGKASTVKAKECSDLICADFATVKWILFSPDDDLFVPNNETINELFSEKFLSQSNKYSYVASRYIMFKSNQPKENCVQFQECWSHHCNIAKACLAPSKQVETFSHEGVASYWGLYSREAFALASKFRMDMTLLLPKVYTSIVEDLSNLLVLSFSWPLLSAPMICLRGDDRRFRRSKTWKPSRVVLNMLNQNHNQHLLLSVATSLRDVINESFARYSINYPQLNITDCLNLIKNHVEGYDQGRSRLYDLSIPIVLQYQMHSKVTFYQGFSLHKYKFSRFSRPLIAIPWDKGNLDVSIYPASLLFGDSRAMDIIYDNKEFCLLNRVD